MGETATITFPDETSITADVNGTCFITDTKPNFPEDMSLVVVEFHNPHRIEDYRNPTVVEPYSIDDRYWFAFHVPSEEELWKATIEEAICDLSMEM